jgi:hypothetical protein
MRLLACAFAAFLLAQDKDEKSKILSVKTTKLFPDPGEAAVEGTLTISHIGKVALIVQQKDGTQRVILHGRELKPYPVIVPPEQLIGMKKTNDRKVATRETQVGGILQWTPDHEKVFYIASVTSGLVIAGDDYESNIYDFILGGMPIFSPDGRRHAFVAAKGKNVHVVVNGQESKAFDDFAAGSLAFSPNSQRHAYATKLGGAWTLYHDAGSFPCADGIAEGTPVFSPDSSKLAYVTFRGNKVTMMVNDKSFGEFDAVADRSIAFSPDSSKLVFGAKLKGKWYLYVDDKMYGPYDAIGDETPLYSKDGSRLIWTARKGAYWYVVENGTEMTLGNGQVDAILRGTPLFSPDGKKLVVGFKILKDWRVWSDAGESDKFDEILKGTVRWTEDSSKFVFVGVRSKAFIPVINLKEAWGSTEMGPIRISRGPTSNTIAWGIKRNRTAKEMADLRALEPKNSRIPVDYWMVAVNGEDTYGPYDDLQPFAVTLSPSGTKVAYPAKRKDKWALYMDGSRRTDELPVWIVFNDNNMMEMVALNDKDGYVYCQEVME